MPYITKYVNTWICHYSHTSITIILILKDRQVDGRKTATKKKQRNWEWMNEATETDGEIKQKKTLKPYFFLCPQLIWYEPYKCVIQLNKCLPINISIRCTSTVTVDTRIYHILSGVSCIALNEFIEWKQKQSSGLGPDLKCVYNAINKQLEEVSLPPIIIIIVDMWKSQKISTENERHYITATMSLSSSVCCSVGVGVVKTPPCIVMYM